MKRQQRELVKMYQSSNIDGRNSLQQKEEYSQVYAENTRLQTVVAGQQAKIADQEAQIKELDRKYQKYYQYVKKNYKGSSDGSVLKPSNS